VESRLEGKFGLEINHEKTRVVEVKPEGGSLDFLGYTFRWDRDLRGRSHKYLNVIPSAKAVDREHPRGAWWEIDWFVRDRLKVHLQRRSQRPHRPPKGVGWYEHIQSFGLKLLNQLPGRRPVHA
jgi:RNA-directed DNA polymerase